MYIRFVVGTDSEDHRRMTGIFVETRLLCERGALQTYEIERLQEINDWFNEHLPVPPFSSEYLLHKGSCWFKATADDAIKKIWEVVVLLKEHDVPVRVMRSKNPGKVLYEDNFQVVAEEYKTL